MRLTDLEPRWIYKAKVFAFRCPHCQKVWLTCKRVQMDQAQQRRIIEAEFGEDSAPGVVGCRAEVAWKFSGIDFTSMTISPSLDASASGHWHGHIKGGAIVGGL